MTTKVTKYGVLSNIHKEPPDNSFRKWPFSSPLGLSNTTHLTARLIIRKAQNSEGQAFILENYDIKNPLPPNPKGRPKGQIIQSGLTFRGRRTIRIISDCYQSLVLDLNDFQSLRELDPVRYNRFCRFLTLTFRNLIPDDKTAKKLLDSFFKRLQRQTGHKNHYVWVAERQKRGAIHFHILTPEKIVDDTAMDKMEMRVKENVWLNKAWNEIVCNWAYRSGKISKLEKKQWLNEYQMSESYYKSLAKFRTGQIKEKPKRPKKSEFLLLPNCVHVNNSGRYMAKYMSKEGQNIIGGLYGASTTSREFLKLKDVVIKDFHIVPFGNEVIKYMYHRSKVEGVFLQMRKLEYNGSLGVWCKNVNKLLQWYFEYLELNNFHNENGTPSAKTLCRSTKKQLCKVKD